MNLKPAKGALASLLLLNTVPAALADHGPVRADTHAPIGVMGDHTHNEGEWMFSYRFMRMEMDGNRDGSSRVPVEHVLKDYMVAPTNMTTDMHMLGAMYAPSDRWTLMAMVPYLDKSMDHVTRMGGMFTTETSGLGDIALDGMYRIHNRADANAHLSFGVSLPTGGIDETGLTPMGNVRLPYPMQLGSGTWDLRFGATWNRYFEKWSWGTQGTLIVRTGYNGNDYRLGDEAQASVWGARALSQSVSLSARLAYRQWGNIKGADPLLNPRVVPTADPKLRAGRRLDFGLGINLAGNDSWRGHRLALEYLLPIHQSLDGPQLEQDWMLFLGYQYTLYRD